MSNTRNCGNCRPQKEKYDLLVLVVIRLGDSVYNGVKEDEGYDVLRFLHTIMYPHKEDFLETVKEYIDFSQNEILWKEMDRMSGLGMSILEEGIEQGIEALILDNLEDGKSEEVIIGKLVKRFGLNTEAAKEYFEKYSKETV